MSDEQETNVIRVDFGRRRVTPQGQAPQPPRDPRMAPQAHYDPTDFEDDPMASTKLEVFTKFIDQGKVAVTLDATAPGVCVPDQFSQQPQLVLNFSLRFFIDDFTYDELAIGATLSFGGKPFYCVVPWGAVKMLMSHHDNRVAVFDESAMF